MHKDKLKKSKDYVDNIISLANKRRKFEHATRRTKF